MNKIKKRSKFMKKASSTTVLSYLAIILFCISILIPFIHELAKSLSHPTEVNAGRVTFMPIGFTFGNYEYFVRKQMEPLGRSLLNTLFLVFVGGFLSVAATVLFAYPLSRAKREFRIGSIIVYIVVFTIIFQRPIIPLRIAFQMYGLLNNLWAIVLNMLINPFLIVLAITNFKSVPDELLEAARIDQANDFTIFYRIVLPLCKPLIVTIFLMQAVGYWNSYLQARLLLTDISLYPIQNFIQNIMSTGGDISNIDYIRDPFANSESIKSALMIFSTIPLTIVYIALQKYFTKGVSTSAGLKG